MEELQWHFYSVPFMFGLAYAITNDSHIRIDIVHMSLPKQLQHLFEILGILILLLPVVIILFDFSLDYAIYAYTHHESSQSPSGLPYRWIVKSVIPISMVLMMIAAVSSLIEHAVLLVLHGKELKNTSRLSLAGRLFLPQSKEQNKSNEGARN
jgi:TRAP-type mannitol/chloroaromatic compound transport system permease small subunit